MALILFTYNPSLVCHEVYIIQLVTMQKEEIQPANLSFSRKTRRQYKRRCLFWSCAKSVSKLYPRYGFEGVASDLEWWILWDIFTKSDSWILKKKSDGKPYEGKPHVRIDEGEWSVLDRIYTYWGMKEKPGYRAMVESKFNELLSLLYKRTQSRPPSKRQAGLYNYEKCMGSGRSA